MTPSAYIRTTVMGREPDLKAVSEVEVSRFEGDTDAQTIPIPWWPSLLDQWGKDGVRAYLEAEALHVFGFTTEAQDKLRPLADGGAEWAARWIDEHPVAVVAPTVDPLA